jgi:hypothetical protein
MYKAVLKHRALGKSYPAAVKKSPNLGREVKKEYEKLTRTIEAQTVKNAYTLPSNNATRIKLQGPLKPSRFGPQAPKFNFKPLPPAALKKRVITVVNWNAPM